MKRDDARTLFAVGKIPPKAPAPLQLQIEQAARCGLSGYMREWPMLVQELTALGYTVNINAAASSYRRLCETIVGGGDHA